MAYIMSCNLTPRDEPSSRVIVLNSAGEPAVCPTAGAVPEILHERPVGVSAPEQAFYLGTMDGQPVHVWVSDDPKFCPEGAEFVNLRSLLVHLDRERASMLSQARQLAHWETLTRFCGRCGIPTLRVTEERARRCPACNHIFYPVICPAIIVAVTNGPRLLLVRNPRHRDGMYSLVAGYVETGETLEEAVAREVLEETSVHVRNIRYFGSQCWPFPSTMMVGFTAEYDFGDIVPQDGEIAAAGWFVPDEFPTIPPPGSISRQLIDAFVAADRG